MVSEEEANTIRVVFTVVAMIVASIFCIFCFSNTMMAAGAMSADVSNFETAMNNVFPIPHVGSKSFEENETYMKYTFDGIMNADQAGVNRGVDFEKCRFKNNKEFEDIISSDTHYIKIRGDTPYEALKTLSYPGVMLNAGFSIPDPSKLYASRFKQISPSEYKIWVITKTPSVETINGALERTCSIGYWY